jgi:sulfite reductase beta subunit-like hemoprotein
VEEIAHETAPVKPQYPSGDQALKFIGTQVSGLAESGLTTREACGDPVRNTVVCPFAGISSDEIFDVTPYAQSLGANLLRHPLRMPR